MAHQVLIVDDTEVNLILFDALVKKLGHCQSVTFSSAVKALEWVQVNDPDLIIVDYMMPELDGIDFVRLLRESPAKDGIPILMITANDRRDHSTRARDRHSALQGGRVS